MTIDQLNRRPFDTSFFTEDNLNGYFSLMTSLGCPYACIFCATGGGKGHRAMNPENVIEAAQRYQEHLERIKAQGAVIHDKAWQVVFSDDDFLRDSKRAIRILELWRKAGLKLKIKTFQSTLQSFLVSEAGRGRAVNNDFMDSIESFKDIFSHDFKIQIGTDGLIDQEIRRLNKGPYNERLIEDVMAGLDKRGIMNEHFLILTNADTTLEDLMRMLLKACIFEIRYPHTFFYPNYAIRPHIGSSAVNKLIETSREALIEGGKHRDDRPDFKEYDLYDEACYIVPENIPSEVFYDLKMFFAARFSFNQSAMHLMLECLNRLMRRIYDKTDLFSEPLLRGSSIFKEEGDLSELAELFNRVMPAYRSTFAGAFMALQLLDRRLTTLRLEDSKAVDSSL